MQKYRLNCASALLLLLLLVATTCQSSTSLLPPKDPPEAELSGFTMDGRVSIEHFYVDDTDSGKQTWYGKSKEELELYRKSMQHPLGLFKAKLIPHLQEHRGREYRDKLM
jgi:hypothetical protein